MPRKLKKEKLYIEVFCEGESEQAYTDFLREKFRDIAVIHRPKSTGTFDEADGKYRNDQKYNNNAEESERINTKTAAHNYRAAVLRFLNIQSPFRNFRKILEMPVNIQKNNKHRKSPYCDLYQP